MPNKKIPPLAYFLPFYGTYRLVRRIRGVERRLETLEMQTFGILRDIEFMKNETFKEVQYYEARIETIYQRLMQITRMQPEDATVVFPSESGRSSHSTWKNWQARLTSLVR